MGLFRPPRRELEVDINGVASQEVDRRPTGETVRHPDILAVILAQEDADDPFPLAFAGSSKMVSCGKENQRGNRDIARD